MYTNTYTCVNEKLNIASYTSRVLPNKLFQHVVQTRRVLVSVVWYSQVWLGGTGYVRTRACFSLLKKCFLRIIRLYVASAKHQRPRTVRSFLKNTRVKATPRERRF